MESHKGIVGIHFETRIIWDHSLHVPGQCHGVMGPFLQMMTRNYGKNFLLKLARPYHFILKDTPHQPRELGKSYSSYCYQNLRITKVVMWFVRQKLTALAITKNVKIISLQIAKNKVHPTGFPRKHFRSCGIT